MYEHMSTSELDARIHAFLYRKQERLEELEKLDTQSLSLEDPSEQRELDRHGWLTPSTSANL